MRYILGSLLLLSLALGAGPARAGAPRLVAELSDFDFGRVYAGEKVEHTFSFRNEGDAPLNIDRVRSSCGCTAALLSATLIAPGEAGEIKTTFDTTRFHGQVAKTVYLYSDDPLQNVAQFHLRGQVQAEIVQKPRRLQFGALPAGTEKEARITLANKGEDVVTLSSVRATAPNVRAELSTGKLAPGESAQIVVRVVPRDGQPRLNAYVIVETSSPRTPQLRIPILATLARTPAGK
ncbi:MAG: hypothetical protein C0617_08705 [Desulfuromonas sp.]|uniref:DUF1573 domain-containing protein n=1 Tax=Desulfuromonas sp. TaxID=892 RepID=UPI000CC5FA7D|nr:DUF1573 domain-containing protein [Desulfuromonas sp.]PLX84150.1 MAG: hypothetical protein C0617_08705 [Desulfuromonas sp.]